MANRIRKLGQLIVLFILITLLGGYVANVKAAERKDIEPLRLRVGYFLPTGQADKSQLRFGYGYDYLKEMAKYTGWEYEFVYASKVRCLEMLENGELDLVGFVVRTPEEEARFAVTALPHGARTLTLLTEINNYEFTEDREDLSGIRVGMTVGSTFNNDFIEYAESHKLDFIPLYKEDEDQLREAFEAGAVDAILSTDFNARGNEKVLRTISKRNLYFIVNRQNVALLEQLDQIMVNIAQQTPLFAYDLKQKYYRKMAAGKLQLSKSEQDYVAQNIKLKVSGNHKRKPINFYDESRKIPEGFTARLLEALSKKSGIKFEYVPTASYNDALVKIQTGKIDMLTSYVGKDYQCDKEGALSDCYLQAPLFFVGPTDKNFSLHDVKTVVISEDFSNAAEDIKKLYPQLNMVYCTSVESGFVAVEEGDADFFLATLPVAQYNISKRHKDFAILAETGITVPMRILFSPLLAKEAVDILNRSISSISSEEINSMMVAATGEALRESEISPWVATITLIAMTLLVAFAIAMLMARTFYRQRKELSAAKAKLEHSLLLTQELEKERYFREISNDLYDNILEVDVTCGRCLSEKAVYTGSEMMDQNREIYDAVLKYNTENFLHIDFAEQYAKNLSRETLLRNHSLGKNYVEFDVIKKQVNRKRFTWVRIYVYLYVCVSTKHVRAVIFVKNIDREKQKELALLKQMSIDRMTGIYNREGFAEKTYGNLVANPEQSFVMVRFSINKFELFNDMFGVEAGDEVLAAMAQRLRIGMEDRTLATYGYLRTDQFAYCLPAKDFVGEKDIKEIKAFLSDLGYSFEFAPCMGIYEIDDINTPIQLMLDRANIAMHSVRNSPNSWAYYDTELRKRVTEEQRVENAMHQALTHRDFKLYLQPIMDVKTEQVSSAEALVRWLHPKQGMMSPANFIPIFENNGFITKLDRYMWEVVCQYQNQRQLDGEVLIPISVNLSRLSLYSHNIVEDLINKVASYELPFSCIKIEITESIYAAEQEVLGRIIKEFRRVGFSILMDDFGSAYSSLNVLKNIDIDTLKIDMKFLKDFNSGTKAHSIIKAVIRMSKELKMYSVAEGVETKEQVNFLKEIGCDYIQGYYYAKPMSIDDFEAFVKVRNNS